MRFLSLAAAGTGIRAVKSLAATVLALTVLLYSTDSHADLKVKARTLDEIKEKGEVVIGVFHDRKPFDYLDTDGRYKGFNILYGDRIAKDLGVKAKYISVDTASRVEYLVTAKADIILADFSVTPERTKLVDFAMPYMKSSIGIISPDSAIIRELKDLNGRTLIVTAGSVTEKYFRKYHPQVKLLPFDHTEETYKALQEGKADALAADNVEILIWARQNKGYTAGIEGIGDEDIVAAAVQKGNKTLLNWLNNHLRTLWKEKLFHKAYDKTLKEHYGPDFDPEIILTEGGD